MIVVLVLFIALDVESSLRPHENGDVPVVRWCHRRFRATFGFYLAKDTSKVHTIKGNTIS